MDTDYTDVAFAQRTERCTDCSADVREGYYYTGPPPAYRITFVCEPCKDTREGN